MNNAELDRLLKSARVPERDEDYWNDFPRRVLAEARRSPPQQETRAPRWGLRFAWGLGLATACVVLGFVLGQRQGGETAMAENGLLQNRKVIEEIIAMFPNRVRAVVNDEAGMRILLADADLPASTPLWVKVCKGDHCTTLVTFSGQELMVGRQKLTVLEDAKDGVILVGDRFVWASDQPNETPNNLRIQAKPLQMAMR
jgi:hypothetical protein